MTALVLSLLAVTPVSVVILDARLSGGADADQGALAVDEIARAFPSSGFKVTTSAQLTTILGLERQRQLMGCSDDSSSCATELANALGTDVVVQTTLAKISDTYRCNVTLLAGRDGTALDRLSVEGSGGALLDRLREEVGAAAARLFAAKRPGNRLDPGKQGFRKYALAPGLLGVALAGAGAVLFVVTEGTWSTLNSRSGRVSDPFGLAAAGRTTQTLAWALTITGGVALAAAAGVLALGGPTEPRVVVAPVAGAGGGGLIFSGGFP